MGLEKNVKYFIPSSICETYSDPIKHKKRMYYWLSERNQWENETWCVAIPFDSHETAEHFQQVLQETGDEDDDTYELHTDKRPMTRRELNRFMEQNVDTTGYMASHSISNCPKPITMKHMPELTKWMQRKTGDDDVDTTDHLYKGGAREMKWLFSSDSDKKDTTDNIETVVEDDSDSDENETDPAKDEPDDVKDSSDSDQVKDTSKLEEAIQPDDRQGQVEAADTSIDNSRSEQGKRKKPRI